MQRNIKIEDEIKIGPSKLYPLKTIASMKDGQIKECMDYYKKNGIQKNGVAVFVYENTHFILEGHEQVVAAAVCGNRMLEVKIVDRKEISFWKQDENLLYQLATIGMTALYDFEAICQFRYDYYPSYYQKKM